MATTKIPGLEKAAFEEPTEPRQRLIWSVYGETKTGKSSFGLWGPGPVVVCDLDRRLERVINDFASGVTTGEPKNVLSMKVSLPKVDPVSRRKDDVVMREAMKEWDRFLTNYDAALNSSLKKGGVRSIVMDTGTELFDLRLLAEFGRLMGIQPRDRGGANAEFVEIIRRGEQYDANVFWLSHAKEEWKDSETIKPNGEKEVKSFKTGNWILDGFGKTNSIVQVVAKTTYNEAVKDVRKRFEVNIIRCGVNAALNGKKFTSADWAVWDEDDKTFESPIVNYGPVAYISSLIIPSTTPEDWM